MRAPAWLRRPAPGGGRELDRVEEVLRQYGQQPTRDGLATDVERALLTARATPAPQQREQLDRFEAELIAVDGALARAGSVAADDRVKYIDRLAAERRDRVAAEDLAARFSEVISLTQRVLKGAGHTVGDRLETVAADVDVALVEARGSACHGILSRILVALGGPDPGDHSIAEANVIARLRAIVRQGQVDRGTSKALARHLAWLQGDPGAVDPAERVAPTMADGDDAPTELRALAGEMHRWAPDLDALRVRDRLLVVARILDTPTAPTGPAYHCPPCGALIRDDQRLGDRLVWNADPGTAGHHTCRHVPAADGVVDAVIACGADVSDVFADIPGHLPTCSLPDGHNGGHVPTRDPWCRTDLDGATCALLAGHDEPCRAVAAAHGDLSIAQCPASGHRSGHRSGRCLGVSGHPGPHQWPQREAERCGNRDTPDDHHGPCHQRPGHRGQHQDATGYQWDSGPRSRVTYLRSIGLWAWAAGDAPPRPDVQWVDQDGNEAIGPFYRSRTDGRWRCQCATPECERGRIAYSWADLVATFEPLVVSRATVPF